LIQSLCRDLNLAGAKIVVCVEECGKKRGEACRSGGVKARPRVAKSFNWGRNMGKVKEQGYRGSTKGEQKGKPERFGGRSQLKERD